MRITIHLALLALMLPAVGSADDLFSEVAVESVFAGSSQASPTSASTPSAAPKSTRITSAGQLGSLLRDAGLEPKRVDGKSVDVVIAHGEWTIPTRVRAAVDRGQIDVTMGLVTPKKGSKWTAERLLELLSLAPEAGGAHFAYDRSKGQLQFRQTLSARDLTAQQLSRSLKEMAELAVSREDAWYKEAETSKQPPTAAPQPLAGAYVAKLGSGEAFALNLTADGKFALAHVKNGRTTTSKGKAERTGDQLRLVGGSVTIAGTVSNAGERGFDYTLAGGKKLVFKKSVK